MIRSAIQYDILKGSLEGMERAAAANPERRDALLAGIERIKADLAEYDARGGPPAEPMPLPFAFDPPMPFGKYKGWRLSSVTDVKYLLWLAQQPFCSGRLRNQIRERLGIDADSQIERTDDDEVHC